MLPGAANNPSISARSKNPTVRRTQRFGNCQDSLATKHGSRFLLQNSSQSAMCALRCLLEVPGATLGQHTEKSRPKLCNEFLRRIAGFSPMQWYYLLQGSWEVRTPGSPTCLTSEYNRPTTSAAGFLPCCCSFPLFPPLGKSPLEVSDVRPNSQSSSVRVERRMVLR